MSKFDRNDFLDWALLVIGVALFLLLITSVVTQFIRLFTESC